MKPTRRKTVLGLGALATGSGAVFTSAGFSNSVTPSSDMRVVVDEDLLLEPGVSFRTGSDPDDNYDPSLNATSSSKFAGSDNNDFFNDNSPSTGSDESTGADIGPDDLPAAFVSDDTNGDITIKVAVRVGETAKFSDLLQVSNETNADQTVGVTFAAFGVDTTASSSGNLTDNGGSVDVENVVGAYTFYSGGTTSDQISTDPDNFDSSTIPGLDEQKIPASPGGLTISPGSAGQIGLEVDMTNNISLGSNDLKSQVVNATNRPSNPFSGEEDTAQLVESLYVGTDPDTV